MNQSTNQKPNFLIAIALNATNNLDQYKDMIGQIYFKIVSLVDLISKI